MNQPSGACSTIARVPARLASSVLVGAVQGDRGAAEHEQADHGHRGRQHRNHDRKRLTADGPQRERDDDTDDDRDQDRRKHEAAKLLPARPSRGRHPHHPRRRTFEQETDGDQEQSDGGRQRRADQRDAGHPIAQLRAEDESQQRRQRREPGRQREPLRRTHPGGGAEIEEHQRAGQQREGQRGRLAPAVPDVAGPRCRARRVDRCAGRLRACTRQASRSRWRAPRARPAATAPSRTGPASSPSRSAAAPPISSRPRALFAFIASSPGATAVSSPVPAMASSNPRAPSTAPARHSQRPTR